jgi:hypothetical protein
MSQTGFAQLIKIANIRLNKSGNQEMCVDFTRELHESLELFHLGFLARYFPQLIAVTAVLIILVTFIAPSRTPRRLFSLFIMIATYFLVEKLAIFLTYNILSYCL